MADDTWQAALDAGWSEEQLLEAFADTIRTILTNYFNHVAGTEIDIPKAPAVSGWGSGLGLGLVYGAI